jgi:cytochrome c
VYIVFQNPKAEGRSLMVVTGVEFKQADASGNPKATETQASAKTNIQDYAGKYKMQGLPFDYVEISIADDKVIMNAGGQGGPVNATDTPDKYDADGKAILYFTREGGKVSGLTMEAMGLKFEGKKE